jgi:hypothetical protein
MPEIEGAWIDEAADFGEFTPPAGIALPPAVEDNDTVAVFDMGRRAAVRNITLPRYPAEPEGEVDDNPVPWDHPDADPAADVGEMARRLAGAAGGAAEALGQMTVTAGGLRLRAGDWQIATTTPTYPGTGTVCYPETPAHPAEGSVAYQKILTARAQLEAIKKRIAAGLDIPAGLL